MARVISVPCVCVLLAGGLTAGAASAADYTPIQVRLLNCDPEADKPDGAFKKGYSGGGYCHADGSHYMRINIAFYKDAKQSIDDALHDVDKIYLCRFKGTAMTCPSETGHPRDPNKDNYALYDKARGINKLAKRVFDWQTTGDQLLPDGGDAVVLPDLDWRNALDKDVAIFPRMQLASAPPLGTLPQDFKNDATAHGACTNWSLSSSNPAGARVLVHSPTQVIAGGYDICVEEGKKKWWGGDGSSQCIIPAVGEYVRQWMEEIMVAHEVRLQRALKPEGTEGATSDEMRKITWRNGQDPNSPDPNNPIYRPSFAFVGPLLGSFGLKTNAGPKDSPEDFVKINSSSLGNVRRAFSSTDTSARAIALTQHESFHRLQWAWEREVDMPGWPGYVNESMPSADVLSLCISKFPGAIKTTALPLDEECINAGKLGYVRGEGQYNFPNRQSDPRYDPITTNDTALFWRYLYEQFSYPVGTPAHPSGQASQIVHESDPLIPLNERYSDEGTDLVGWLYQGFVRAKDKNVTAFVAVDDVLKAKLGRGFDDVVQDFHTALYLKDYTDTDDRWRFEWTHKAGHSATTLLSAGKPFDVPNDLYGRTCGAGGICDGLHRTHRVLDSWRTVRNAAIRDLLPFNDSRVSASPTYLGVYGTEAASVSPDSSWSGRTMRVRAWHRPGEQVRFRLFSIVRSGNELRPVPQSVPVPVSNPVLMRETSEWVVSIPPNTVELLLIASAGAQGGTFEYQFGNDATAMAILSPQESNQALIGSPLSNRGRRPFVMALSIKDTLGNVVSVTNKSDLTIEIPGCAATSCVLSDSDYTIIPAVGGNLLSVVTVPSGFYPSGSGDLTLRVTYLGSSSDAKPNALKYSDARESGATTLVLDESGSMGDFNGQKMAALKAVAKGLVQSLVEPAGLTPLQLVSVVSFTTDASTRVPLRLLNPTGRQEVENAIDNLSPKWLTAIGDGLYEAQSGLAAQYDSLGHPAREVVLLLSDGKNTIPATPETYYAKDPGPPQIPTGDGNGEWYKNDSYPLYYHARRDKNLRVPTLTAVGIGQDADLTTLDKVTRLSGLHPLFVKGPESNPSASPNQITLDLADGMLGALESALGYSRVSSARITGREIIMESILGGATPEAGASSTGVPSTVNIQVEPGATELRISVTSNQPNGSLGRLYRPEASQEEVPTAVSGDGSSRSYRVVQPPEGTWTFTSDGDRGDEPDVFVSAAVFGSLKLFTFADARFRTDKDEVLAGSPVVLRTLGVDGGRVATACGFLTASVTAPGASEPTEIWLADDGRHDDGTAGDGVFGGFYRTTAAPGIYDVTFRAICKSPVTDAWVLREQRSGFVVQLREEDDPDGDGNPTAVELLCLNPYDPNDVDLDFDGDGLTNRQEIAMGTSPCRSDTDGGGLADGSEVAIGSDPFNPVDDDMTAPLPELTPGNAKIHIHSGIIVGSATLEIETASGTSGPWMPVSDAWTPGQNTAIHSGLINGALYCYRLRLAVGSRASAWSYPLCATPNGDATPPTISVVRGIQACGTDYVQPELAFHDSPYPSDAWDSSIDLGLSSTGVVAMRVWEGVGPAPDTAVWQAPNTSPVIKTPTASSTISIQVRDGAGNLSKVAMLSVTCVQPECFFKPKDIGCCTDVATCGLAREYALFAESQLSVGDAVKVKNAGGTAVPVANKGSGQTALGVEAQAGSVASVGPVDLRDRSKVYGAIECGGAVTSGNGVVVTGGTVQRSTALQLPSIKGFSVKFPVTGGNEFLDVGKVKPLAPGSYGSINVQRDAQLLLSTGTYFIDKLTVESMGKVKANTTAGPIYLYIKSGLNYRGAVTDTSGRYDRIFWGYFGTAYVSIEAPLVGTIVAPSAPVSLKTVTGTTHRGAVFAKQLDIQARALFVHHPFIGTWNAPAQF